MPLQLNSTSRNGTTQAVAYTGSSAAASANFLPETYHIRIVANSACHYKIGSGAQTATTSDPFLPANWYEYVRVNPGENIAFIRAATNGTIVTATSGTALVTELT